MDNRVLCVVSESMDDLRAMIKILFHNAAGSKVTHYAIKNVSEKTTYYGDSHDTKMVEDVKGVPTLIFYWSESSGQQALPFPLDEDGCFSFVKGWLNQVEYVHEPDHDGSNRKGWKVFNEHWGHVLGNCYAVFAVQPEWAMYGK